MNLVFGAPGRYVQGAGAIAEIGAAVAQCGASASVIVDSIVRQLIEEPIRRSCASVDISPRFIPFDGEMTQPAIEALKADFDEAASDVVIGAGGGKCIDAGKALAKARGAALITLPTVASNDAPPSKNYVVYDEHHQLLEVGHLAVSPRYVIVDTSLIARAPRAFLVAGIGDALTKSFEAEQCLKAEGRNGFGGRSSLAAVALARECYRILRQDAAAALKQPSGDEPTKEFERVIEAVVLMSGIGFESGGLSIAHSMTRGLSRVPGAREAPHGAQVAYALLVQLVLEGRDSAFLNEMLNFYNEIGLPKTLAAMGVHLSNDALLLEIAQTSLLAPHARNFERKVTAEEMIAAMRRLEAWPASAYERRPRQSATL